MAYRRLRSVPMDHCKRLSEIASELENLGLTATDHLLSQDLLELAMACKEKAARISRRHAAKPAAIYLSEI
jgi:hypothetical protein